MEPTVHLMTQCQILFSWCCSIHEWLLPSSGWLVTGPMVGVSFRKAALGFLRQAPCHACWSGAGAGSSSHRMTCCILGGNTGKACPRSTVVCSTLCCSVLVPTADKIITDTLKCSGMLEHEKAGYGSTMQPQCLPQIYFCHPPRNSVQDSDLAVTSELWQLYGKYKQFTLGILKLESHDHLHTVPHGHLWYQVRN